MLFFANAWYWESKMFGHDFFKLVETHTTSIRETIQAFAESVFHEVLLD